MSLQRLYWALFAVLCGAMAVNTCFDIVVGDIGIGTAGFAAGTFVMAWSLRVNYRTRRDEAPTEWSTTIYVLLASAALVVSGTALRLYGAIV